ncbi:YdeI/OmpD-associated family protein [Sphingomicrobium clamense]|uniref:YdeI/OmpD-associated family protein n=1 Tax=Sphingomicrobium clamense TaxID=2851013 RepID=UPI0031F2F450
MDAYLAKSADFARPILVHLRERAHAAAPEAAEDIKWGAPAFVANGQILFIMAAFKAHVAVNFWRGQELLGDKALDGAMGQLGKIATLDDLPDDDALDALIVAALDLTTTPPKKKANPKPEKLHPDFAAALDKAPKAKAVYEGFPPGARREYCDWVNDAKRDATRDKRIAQAVEWLAEGKKRNWKYQDC